MKKLIFLSLLLAFTQLGASNVQYSAHHGNPYAQYDLGLQYKYSSATTRNFKEAFKWLHKAALKGHISAQYEFALMFHYGQGVRKNADLARLWFSRSAKKGHPKAEDILYRFYSASKPNYYRGTDMRYSKISK